MRLVTYEAQGTIGVGVKVEDGVIATSYSSMLDFIKSGEEAIAAAKSVVGQSKPIQDFKLLAPIHNPGKLLFLGVNYISHLDEFPAAILPTYPHFFSKLPSAIIGPGQYIIKPYPDCKLDYEVELAVIIGKTAKKVTRETALEHVFGYTISNDVSARDIQFTDNQLNAGKGCDTFCPLGPEIVLRDEITNPQVLNLSTYVNGELRQKTSTNQMLFDVATIIEFLSRHITLYPGDLISTGTPAGVSYFTTPPIPFLNPGDTVTVKIDEIGELTNYIVAGWDS